MYLLTFVLVYRCDSLLYCPSSRFMW